MTTASRSRFRPAEWTLLAVAAAWSAAVPLGVLFAPLYSTASVDATGAEMIGTATSVQVNGPWVLFYALVPLVAVLVVGAVLWERAPGRGTGPLAWTVIGLLAAFTVASMMTLGILILPVTGCLIAVAIVRQSRRRAHG